MPHWNAVGDVLGRNHGTISSRNGDEVYAPRAGHSVPTCRLEYTIGGVDGSSRVEQVQSRRYSLGQLCSRRLGLVINLQAIDEGGNAQRSSQARGISTTTVPSDLDRALWEDM